MFDIVYHQLSLIFLFFLLLSLKDPLNETAEDPTLWTVNTLNGELEHDTIETNLKETVDSTGTSFKVNLTVVNSTSNYTMTNEVRLSHFIFRHF